MISGSQEEDMQARWHENISDGSDSSEADEDCEEDMIEIELPNKMRFIISKRAPNTIPGHISFTTDDLLVYHPFCDDFGPFNLSAVYHFCRDLRTLLQTYPTESVQYFTTGNQRQAANCAFLLASFSVMDLDQSAEEAWRPFESIPQTAFAGFRDASYSAPTFTLSVLDCLRGLTRARDVGFINFKDGSFDIEEYDLLDDPANGDVHVLVPGRFVAFKGPVEERILAGRLWADPTSGSRLFHPSFYVPLFRDLGVKAVVRLNERRYAGEHFERAGIAVRDLPFDDCTVPPLAVVFRFFRTVDEEAAGGAVAVHCRAGLGRTGTLVALWLMRTHRFSARDAIAWLRIVRPGSVIGPQQQYLEDMQAKMWQWGALPPHKQAYLLRNGCAMTPDLGPAPAPPGPAAASSAERSQPAAAAAAAAAAGEAVAAGVDRRAEARRRARAAPCRRRPAPAVPPADVDC
jgi:cell division cycle 14